ncbi:MAG: hypothetical protein II624_10465, partial [Prevotella sp.]|nr:hypothetical protein [Prevotella sp.]
MKRLKQFNLSQLSSILDSNNYHVNPNDNQEEQLVSEYLSKHLLIARNPPVAQLMSRLEGDTVIMPEMRVIILTKGHANPIINLTEHYFEAGQM